MTDPNASLGPGSMNWARLLSDEFRQALLPFIWGIAHPADLARAARVCKDWRKHAIPRLWTGTCSNRYPHQDRWRSPSIESLQKLAQTPHRLQFYLPLIKYYECWSEIEDPDNIEWERRMRRENMPEEMDEEMDRSPTPEYFPPEILDPILFQSLRPYFGRIGHGPWDDMGIYMGIGEESEKIMLNKNLLALEQQSTDMEWSTLQLLPETAPKLQWIDIENCLDPNSDAADDSVNVFRKLTKLRYLHLEDFDTPANADRDHFRTMLLQLPLYHVRLFDMEAIALSPFLDGPYQFNTGLRSLRLDICESKPFHLWDGFLQKLNRLESLDLHMNDEEHESANALLLPIGYCTMLEELKLYLPNKTTISTQGLLSLRNGCGRLRKLRLTQAREVPRYENPLTAEHIATFGISSKALGMICVSFPHLESLNIDWPMEAGPVHMVALAQTSPHLRRLNLSASIDFFGSYPKIDKASPFAELEQIELDSYVKWPETADSTSLQWAMHVSSKKLVDFIKAWLPNVHVMRETPYKSRNPYSSFWLDLDRQINNEIGPALEGAQWERVKRHTASVKERLWVKITGLVDGN